MRTGRPPKYDNATMAKAAELRASGRTFDGIAKELGVSYGAVYHWLSEKQPPTQKRTEQDLRANTEQAAAKHAGKAPKDGFVAHIGAGLLARGWRTHGHNQWLSPYLERQVPITTWAAVGIELNRAT